MAALFASYGKAFRYGFIIEGPDASGPTSDKLITGDPADYYPPPPTDPAGQGNFFRTNATAGTEAWFSAMWTEFAARLSALELPKPAWIFTDLEGVLYGGRPYRESPSGTGYFDEALAGVPPPPLEQSLRPGLTLRGYLDARTTTADGVSFDPYNPDQPSPIPVVRGFLTVNYPANYERVDLVFEAQRTNHTWAINTAILGPAQAALGSNVLTGNWNSFVNSQEFQAIRENPLLPAHFGDAVGFPLSAQVVINYCDPAAFQYNEDTLASVPADPRWETYRNWLTAYPQVGPTPPLPPSNTPSYFPTYTPMPFASRVAEQWQRLWLFTRLSQARAAARSRPDVPLFPSIQLDGDPTSVTERRQFMGFMTRYMVATTQMGAVGFWLFEPDTGVVGSQAYQSWYELVLRFNKAMRARQPRRNRVNRHVG